MDHLIDVSDGGTLNFWSQSLKLLAVRLYCGLLVDMVSVCSVPGPQPPICTVCLWLDRQVSDDHCKWWLVGSLQHILSESDQMTVSLTGRGYLPIRSMSRPTGQKGLSPTRSRDWVACSCRRKIPSCSKQVYRACDSTWLSYLQLRTLIIKFNSIQWIWHKARYKCA